MYMQNGWTPLMQASQEGHVDVVNVLLDNKANPNHQTDVPVRNYFPCDSKLV